MSRVADYCGELEALVEWAMELIELHSRLRGLANPDGREKAHADAWVLAADELLSETSRGRCQALRQVRASAEHPLEPIEESEGDE